MASSSSVPESSIQETTQGTSTQQEAPAYEIKGRTMSLEEWELTVQVERPIDFASLLHHGYDIKSLRISFITSTCSTVQHMRTW